MQSKKVSNPPCLRADCHQIRSPIPSHISSPRRIQGNYDLSEPEGTPDWHCLLQLPLVQSWKPKQRKGYRWSVAGLSYSSFPIPQPEGQLCRALLRVQSDDFMLLQEPELPSNSALSCPHCDFMCTLPKRSENQGPGEGVLDTAYTRKPGGHNQGSLCQAAL